MRLYSYLLIYLLPQLSFSNSAFEFYLEKYHPILTIRSCWFHPICSKIFSLDSSVQNSFLYSHLEEKNILISLMLNTNLKLRFIFPALNLCYLDVTFILSTLSNIQEFLSGHSTDSAVPLVQTEEMNRISTRFSTPLQYNIQVTTFQIDLSSLQNTPSMHPVLILDLIQEKLNQIWYVDKQETFFLINLLSLTIRLK